MISNTLNYLYNLKRFGIKIGLDTTLELLKNFDNPHKKFVSIHVAGTKGKGSVSAMIYSILRKSGFSVGLYTSPHLVKFNERIKVNDRDITDREVMELTEFIKRKIENTKTKPTFFEFTTAMAFYYFAKKGVDFAVVEVGCGGRLDSTNVINPAISIITNISLDHTNLLGNTKMKIAREKAGIIKENGTIITAERDKKILNLFENICQKKKARLFVVQKELKGKIVNSSLDYQRFITNGKLNSEFYIPLLGEYQLNNALIAILAILLLKEKGNKISLENIKKGIKSTSWYGRLQIIKKQPLIIFDCAHNIDSFNHLKKFLKKIKKRKILLIGISIDKDVEKMISIIAPIVDFVIISKGNYKPASMERIKKAVLKFDKKAITIANPSEAFLMALKKTEKNDAMIVTGSMYLVGDIIGDRKLFTNV